MDALERLAADIRDAERVVALTGAGISAPSGVPTFRGEGGVWEQFDAGQFTSGRFERDPAGFWNDRLTLQRAMFGAPVEPNVAHEALCALERAGHLEAIVTQNTDGLHLGAAAAVPDGGGPDTDPAESVVELHGNAHRVVCTACGGRADAAPAFERVAAGETPPRCDCGGVYKPDVVLFGETLSHDSLERAQTLARTCDVFLAIGSSLVVEPAASLPRLAARNGATVAVFTLEETPVDGVATVVHRADVTDALPDLYRLVTGREQPRP
ncbi:SIR2 family NAD-dependent protein deacylase [Natronobiforma cellulositropha]|uniref:SIR2 family NAD-dependent protein deacylase n=1 Tax=Natronobiforma cellulositropha TaxID=1679076 RepID=UPI0021D5A9B4|nr:Sir2 family NAD-dependent protein deacetylase [Natronobiforma cellulositropha]